MVMPFSSLRSLSKLITCALIETSNAEIGSSAIINVGSTTKALAIPIR